MTGGPRAVTAEELVRALKRRRTALPAEIGTFVALEACESLVQRGPCVVSLAGVTISDEGNVSVTGDRADEESAARGLHATLTSLLVAAGPAPAPGLMRLVEEGPSGGAWTLEQMRDDLEASLVPLNRTASRRVLARLVRETSWEQRSTVRAEAQPTLRELDSELSSLLGVPDEPAPEPAPEPQRRAPDRDPTQVDPVEDLDDDQDEVHFFAAESVADKPVPGRGDTQVEPSPALPMASVVHAAKSFDEPARGQLRHLDALSEPPAKAGSRGIAAGLFLVALAVALVIGTLVVRPDVLDKLTGNGVVEPAQAKEPKVVTKIPTGGDLVLHVSTERAQVLRFLGRGPVTVEHLPLGVAHEFVAIAEGVSPTRLVVPADAEWERTPEGARYEAAMQLGKPVATGSALDLGETLLPQNVGTPRAELGSVRIVTTPRGAKVYQLIGFAPEVKVQDLPLDQTQELMIFRKGYVPIVRVIAPSDFVEQDGRKVADVRIDLAPVPKTR